jgi:hypothetical protein
MQPATPLSVNDVVSVESPAAPVTDQLTATEPWVSNWLGRIRTQVPLAPLGAINFCQPHFTSKDD